MFCNKCGKENADGTKITIRCGAPLPAAETVQSPAEAKPKSAAKAIVMLAAAVTAAAVAAVNIVGVYTKIETVKLRQDIVVSSAGTQVMETDKYIYYTGNSGLYSVEKSSGEVEKISQGGADLKAAENKCVYFTDNGKTYKVTDTSGKKERVKFIPSENGNGYVFFDGKFSYTLTEKGRLTAKLNYEGASAATVLNKKLSGMTISSPKLYRGELYMKTSSRKGDGVIKMSLGNGKVTELVDEAVSQFSFLGDKLVYIADGFLCTASLSGKNHEELASVADSDYTTLRCGNGYIYYGYSSVGGFFGEESYIIYRYDEDGGAEELECDRSYLYMLGDSMAAREGESLLIYDEDGIFVEEYAPEDGRNMFGI